MPVTLKRPLDRLEGSRKGQPTWPMIAWENDDLIGVDEYTSTLKDGLYRKLSALYYTKPCTNMGLQEVASLFVYIEHVLKARCT